MAARRLIIILVVLLVVSSVLAALAPRSERQDETTSTTATTPPVATTPEPEPPSPGGQLLSIDVTADADHPPVVEAEVGDRLRLLVAVEEPSQVAIAELGLLGYGSPGAPAAFDILLREPARLAVTSGPDGATTALIEVTAAGHQASEGTEKGAGQKGERAEKGAAKAKGGGGKGQGSG